MTDYSNTMQIAGFNDDFPLHADTVVAIGGLDPKASYVAQITARIGLQTSDWTPTNAVSLNLAGVLLTAVPTLAIDTAGTHLSGKYDFLFTSAVPVPAATTSVQATASPGTNASAQGTARIEMVVVRQ